MAFNIKQNNTSPSLQAILKEGSGTVINLTGASVRINMKAVGGTGLKVNSAMTIVNATGGIIQYDWQSGDTDTVGSYALEFEVTYADGSLETFPNSKNLSVTVIKELN